MSRLRIVTLWLLLLLFQVGPATMVADDWPQWRGPRRDGVWRETGIVDAFGSNRLPIKWRAAIHSGYSGPTVAEGRVFVTDRLIEPTQTERILCFDASSGDSLWSVAYEAPYEISYQAGPRASVTVDSGRAFALGAMGHLHCLDAAAGRILWKKDLAQAFQIRMPMWGIAAAPLKYKSLVILQIGGAEACVVALRASDGRTAWSALDDRAGYSAPIVVEQAGRDVVVCWTGDSVSGLDPNSGSVLWRFPFSPTRMPIGVATPVVEDRYLFVTSFYDGSLMLRLDSTSTAIHKVWHKRGRDEKHTEALHSIISTPLLIDGYIYGVDSYGELRCLDARTGQRIWEDQSATPRSRWSTIHFVRNGDRVWMFNERGELIIARLSPRGYEEISRAALIEPTLDQLRQRGGVCWAHPAFARRHVFARNDKELVCASLAADDR